MMRHRSNGSAIFMAKYGLNKVILIGNLGQDPELKYLDQGVAVTSLNLACTESIRTKDGQNQDRTEWVRVVLWRGQAEVAAKYCRKGSTVSIEGKLTTRSWETESGEKRSITEVEGRRLVLLDGKPQRPAFPPAQMGTAAAQPPVNLAPAVQSPTATAPGAETSAQGHDDLPF